MAIKVKSIDTLEKVSSGVVVHAQATVTFTDTVKDYQETITTGPLNPVGMTANQVKQTLRAYLVDAIAARAVSLEQELAVKVDYANAISVVWSDLVAKGITVLLALMLFLAPALAWAGTLQPEWGDATAVVLDPSSSASGTPVPGNRRPVSMGTIDSSTYYVTHIWINAWEAAGSTGSLGVSVYAVDTSTGVSSWNLPMSVVEIGNAEAAIVDGATTGSGQMNGSTGITKYLGAYENIPYINIAVGANNASDTWYTKIKYKRMKGQY